MNTVDAIIMKGKLRKQYQSGMINNQTLAEKMLNIDSKIRRAKTKHKAVKSGPKIKHLSPNYHIPKVSEINNDLIMNKEELELEQNFIPKSMFILLIFISICVIIFYLLSHI